MIDKLYYATEDDLVLTTAGVIVVVVIIALLFATAVFLFSARRKKQESGQNPIRKTRQLVFSSAAMALAMITSEFIPTLSLPTGGSITLFSMLFITLIGYWYGFGPGLMTALAYGLLQFVLDPKFVSVSQIFLDYILAFGALGLSGIFSERKHGLILGYITGVLGRYFFAWLAGVVIWGIYAPADMPVGLYSLIYQGSYLLPEAILTLILLALPPVRKGLQAIRKIAING